ncbi:MAG: hypothetical protein ACW98I_18245, partial [Candidatus Hodarchaeales archaeon]
MIIFKKNGRLLLGIGSIGMIIFTGIFFIINLLTDLNQISGIDLHAFNITLTASTLGANGWFLSSVISGISGLIGVKGYTDLSESEQKKDLRYTWGVFG